MDSGASDHCTNDVNDLSNVRVIHKVIATAGESAVTATMIGDVYLQLDNNKIKLNNVLFSNQFTAKIVSISKLIHSNNCQVVFNPQSVIVYQDKQIVLSGSKWNQLWIIQAAKPTILLTVNLHNRLGHINARDIRTLTKSNAFDNFSAHVEESSECLSCAMGKQTRSAFKSYSSVSKATHVLGKFHCDIAGPINIDEDPLNILKLNDTPRYWLIMVDEFSGKVLTEILRSKDQATECIKNWIELAEKITGQQCRALHSDNGGEFMSNELISYCKSKNIIKTTSLPYTKQHNGTAERNIRTITECARTIIHHAKLHTSFWPEAVRTATYLHGFRNKSGSIKTINETFFNVKPNVNQLRTFGCDAYVHVPQEHRKKFEQKSQPAIFIGYPIDKVAGWKFLAPHGEILESRDVVFLESSFTIARSEMKLPSDVPQSSDTVSNNEPLTTIFRQANTSSQDEMSNITHNQHVIPITTTLTRRTNRQPRVRVLSPVYHPPTLEDVDTTAESQQQPTDIVEDLLPGPTLRTSRYPQRSRARSTISDPRNYDLRDGQRLRRSGVVYFSAANTNDTPTSYEQAMKCDQSKRWLNAIQEELDAHSVNGTWEVIKKPKHFEAVTSRWVFTKKTGDIFKARLVARGFTQQEHIHYHETYAPVMRYKSIRIILALSVEWGHQLFNLDIRTAFLYASLDEKILMYAPDGVKCPSDHILLLKKALYGLKQSPRQFNTLLDTFIKSLGFSPLLSDQCVYQKKSLHNHIILLGVFVDDIMVSVHPSDIKEWTQIKSSIQNKFQTKDLGSLTRMLGIQIDQGPDGLTLCQSDMIKQLLVKQGMSESKPVGHPEVKGKQFTANKGQASLEKIRKFQSIIGSLTYICYATRPDLTHVVNMLARHASNPSDEHVQGIKRVLRYLNGTRDLLLTYDKPSQSEKHPSHTISIQMFSDADWAGDPDTRLSVSGTIIKLNNNTITWKTSRQKSVAASTAEAEYVALSEAVKDALWLQNFLSEIIPSPIQVKAFCDAQSTINMIKNDSHSKARHIDIRTQLVNQTFKKPDFQLNYCPGTDMQADIMTKATDESTFIKHRNKLM